MSSNTKSVYLACAVDREKALDVQLKQNIKDYLTANDYVIFDPGQAFAMSQDLQFDSPANADLAQSEFIYRVNYKAMMEAENRVFLVTGTPSWGMPIELFLTVSADRSFALISATPDCRIPIYLRRLLMQAAAVQEQPNQALKLALDNALDEYAFAPSLWVSRGGHL